MKLHYDGPVVLAIMDGVGLRRDINGNAVKQAHTEFLNQAVAGHQTLSLHASGEAVGIMSGDMGNSEAGHNAIGSGQCKEIIFVCVFFCLIICGRKITVRNALYKFHSFLGLLCIPHMLLATPMEAVFFEIFKYAAFRLAVKSDLDTVLFVVKCYIHHFVFLRLLFDLFV